MSLNSVNIMGNLTRDPELKYTNSGRAVCNISLANNRIYTKDGNRMSDVSYFDIEAWGQTAENVAKYLTKGSGIIVDGRLKQDRWEQEGKTRSKVRIVANNIHFLPKRSGQDGSSDDYSQSQPQQQNKKNQQTQQNNSSNSSKEESLADAIAWDE